MAEESVDDQMRQVRDEIAAEARDMLYKVRDPRGRTGNSDIP